MVQCDKLSTKAQNGTAYGKTSTEKKATSYQSPAAQKSSSATKTNDKNNSWGQFKNESNFKSLHHC